MAIFGGTYQAWLACGESFCSAKYNWYSRVLQIQYAALATSDSRDTVFECGYGYSFALAVCALMSSLISVGLLAFNNATPLAPNALPAKAGAAWLGFPRSETNSRQGQSVAPTAKNAPVVATAPTPELNSRREGKTDHSKHTTADHAPTEADTDLHLPEGPGWEYDDATALYWSNDQELYFDPSSGHFYDGATDCWYDPHTAAWYKL